MRYPTTPTLSVEAVQLNGIESTAVIGPMEATGTVGGTVSLMMVTTKVLVVLPAALVAVTLMFCGPSVADAAGQVINPVGLMVIAAGGAPRENPVAALPVVTTW